MNTNNIKKYAPKARKAFIEAITKQAAKYGICLLYTSPSPRDDNRSRMPSSA